MAITFVDSDTVDQAGAQSLTFTIPGGATTDDFMVAFVKQSENTGQQVWDDDGGGGNGWTREAYNRTTSGRDQETAVYWKIHDGSEPNPTFTWNSGGTNEPMSGTLAVYRGVDTVNPIQDLQFLLGQNDANPPNPSVNISTQPATIVAFHAATHDDISSPAAPTGFTMRAQVWAGTAGDHRNHFVADLIGTSPGLGSYTAPDWQHSVLNTTPEYATYILALREIQPIGVTIYDDAYNYDDSDTITGFGFEAVQGTGKVELWSDPAGTIKVLQTVTSWADTSIQYTAVQGGLSNNTTVYLVVTNDTGDASSPAAIQVGLLPYKELIKALNPDHYWPLDNSYNDEGITGPVRNMTSGVVGGGAFVTSPISEDTTHTWHQNGVTVRREIADSANMNVTISSQERTICSWVQLNGIQKSMGAIWKEGGGVQNLAFLVGIGNVLVAQLADVAGSRDNVQAFSDFRLKADRPYHIVMRYTHIENPSEMRLFIDGIEQSESDGNPMTLGIFDSHSGDVTWGDPDNNLETGGTDIAYAGQEDTYLNHFATWSDNSAQTGALDKVTEIPLLFERGATADFTLSSDTVANMQIALDAIADTVRPDWPVCIRVESATDASDFTLNADNITFDDGATIHVQWMGSGTLTWKNFNGSNASKGRPTGNGTLNFETPAVLTLTGLQNPTEVRVYEAGTTTEVAGQEDVIAGLFSSNIEVSSVDIVIHALGFLSERLENVDTGSGDVSLTIQQRIDRQYLNP